MFNTRNKHIKYILNKINENRIKNLNCDCSIRNGDQIFPCHEIILRLASPVFKTLIENERTRSNSENLFIDVTSIIRPSDQFENILDYIYTGRIEISDENIFEIIYLATVLQIDLVQFCCKTIMELLDVSNVNSILQIAYQLEHDNLIKICNSFINFEFYNMENFLHLFQNKDLKRIISDPKLILWNRETKHFIVGHKYALELERIAKELLQNDLFEPENVISMDLKYFLKTILKQLKSSEKVSKFLIEKRYAIPSGFTVPIQRFLPFGMHPHQFDKIPTLCSKTVFDTMKDCSPDIWKIRKIILYLVPKWNNLCSIVAGMDISYQKIWDESEIMTNKWELTNSENYEKRELNLRSTENITRIQISHSWIINSLLFETDQGKIFGPFGDPNPPQYEVQITNIDLCNLNSEYLYLHGFHYINIMSFEWQVWNQVSIECSLFNISRLKIDFSEIFDYLSKQINLNNIIEYRDDIKSPKKISLLNTRSITFLNAENNIY